MTSVPGRPIPTTFEYIEAMALREPQRQALVQDHQGWTYQQLYLDLIRVTRVLDGLGVKRGDRVAVGVRGHQATLVLLVAAENVGAATLSFLPEGDIDLDTAFGLVDWVFSDQPQQVPPTARFVSIDEDFVGLVQRAEPAQAKPYPRVVLEMHEPVRISRTSGSSGRSRFMVLTRQAQEYWMRTGMLNATYKPDTRLLVVGPMVMNAIYARSCACLRIGAVVLELSQSGLAGHDITHLLALPALLEELIQSTPRGWAPRQPVSVATAGGFVSPGLRERAARVFGGRVASRYGANECSGICEDMDATGCGVLSAGVDVRIVDEAGRDVPHGELGIIVVRTPGMVAGYVGDEEATRAAFRDGWFHSGDWGTMVGPRMLRLAGRHDDLINVGGLKFPASRYEQRVCELTGANECAVLSVNLDGGTVTIGIVVVDDGAHSRDAMREQVAQGLELGISTGAKVIFVPKLPRMGTGKIDRQALHRLLETPPPDVL